MTSVSASGEDGSPGSRPDGPTAGSPAGDAVDVRSSVSPLARPLSRRGFLRAAGLTAVAAPASAALAACGGGSGGSKGTRPVRIGFVTPQTGSLNGFADADIYTINAMRANFAKGIMVGNQSHPIEIVYRDSQSDPNQAASAASDLIFKDRVDIMLVGATSDTTNPVADQCEANQVPCISTATPWENWFTGRGGRLGRNFTWTYHVFWGLDDLAAVYGDMWRAQTTDRKIGLLMPNDTDGDQFAQSLPNAIARSGFTVPQGLSFRYEEGSADVATMPARMAGAGVDILAGVPSSSDFSSFWKKSSESSGSGDNQLFKPKIVTLSRALLFPSDVLATLGSAGDKLGTEVWWTPSHPYHSSLTGATPKQLAADYTSKSGKEWVQPLGFSHALFEVVNKALANVSSIDDKASIARAIGGVRNLASIVGPLTFGNPSGATTTLPANVARTPLVGGQWRSNNNAGATPYDLYITSNNQHPDIHLTKAFEAL